MLVRIDIVRSEMQLAGSVVNHAAAHRDGVLQDFISDADLFKRMNAARRNREIDRAPADDVAFARIGPPFVKIDLVAAPSQIRREQSARQTATDENKFCRHSLECLTADYADITDINGRTWWIFRLNCGHSHGLDENHEDFIGERWIAARSNLARQTRDDGNF